MTTTLAVLKIKSDYGANDEDSVRGQCHNDNCSQELSTYYAPRATLAFLHVSSHWLRQHRRTVGAVLNLHLIGKKTASERLSNLPKVTWMENNQASLRPGSSHAKGCGPSCSRQGTCPGAARASPPLSGEH